MNTWHPLEFSVHRSLKTLPLQGEVLWLGFSGGADSTATLLVLKSLEAALGFRVKVLHCHHGVQDNREFRDRSREFTRKLAQVLGVEWVLALNENAQLSSESELREFRQAQMEKLAADAWRVWGHHRDDLLETRLLRLIRGTGVQGLEAMSLNSGKNLRPLLLHSRAEIEAYLSDKKQDFLVDPAQDDLRSFVRNQWLPLLETRVPGGVQSLAASLETIAASSGNMGFSLVFESQNGEVLICQNEFCCLSDEQKMQVLARYLMDLGVRNYTKGQIKEILKRLDIPKSVHRFELSGLQWDIDAKNIRASKTVK